MRAKLTIAICAIASIALAGSALAAVLVYKNDFSGKRDFRDVKLRGKRCKKDGSRKKERFQVRAKRGRTTCRVKLPVVGDAPQPDHELRVKAKVKASTPRSIRKKVYVGVAVRHGKKRDYELRVFPNGRRFALRRTPRDEGFPVRGKAKAIGKVGQRNVLRIRAFGDEITGWIKKRKVGPVTDPAPRDMDGRKMFLVLGHKARSKRDAVAWFDQVRVRVPRPG